MKKKNEKIVNPIIDKLTDEILSEYNPITSSDLNSMMKSVFENAIQKMMNREFDKFIGHKKYDNKVEKDNYRNGHSSKKVKTEYGEISLNVPRDRNADFEPIIVKKYERDVSELIDMIFALYSKGMSTRDVSAFIYDKYRINYSPAQISQVTNEVIEDARLWQNRKLENYYPIAYIDAIHFNIVESNTVVKKAAYVILGINADGYKDILGIYIGENESAKYWMSILNILRNRGINKIGIICSDNLSGIKQAIETIFPETKQQRCVIHMIRNSTKYVSYKDIKEFCLDLKTVYQSASLESAEQNLDIFEEKWGKKYQSSVLIWRRNWAEIITMFNYPPEIRKLIYTTNPIENLNSVLRSHTKTKRVFPSEESLLKILFIASQKIIKKWEKTRVKDWYNLFEKF